MLTKALGAVFGAAVVVIFWCTVVYLVVSVARCAWTG